MALEENHNAYNPEDLDEEEDDEEESADFNHASLNLANNAAVNVSRVDLMNPSVVVDDEDDDVDVDEDEDVDDSTSSSNVAAVVASEANPSSLLNHHHHSRLPPPPVVAAAGGDVTVALPPDHSLPELKRHRVDEVAVAVEGKKPVPIDESRRLFQRLWTDEDEIELLQGFLEYTTSRGVTNSSHHHDTTAFYDQIKSKLQLDFNKNQLVEKLRRLKKKYRNVVNKMGSGKEYVFKSPHDQATFEISRKIWGGNGGAAVAAVRGGVVAEEGGFDDDETNHNFSINFIDQSANRNFISNHNPIPNPNLNPNPNGIDSLERKTPRSRKRSRGGGVLKIEEKPFGFSGVPNLQQNVSMAMPTPPPTGTVPAAVAGIGTEPVAMAGVGTGPGPGPGPGQGTTLMPAPTSTPTHTPATSLIEETVRSSLSPIFKELLNSVMNSNGPMMGSSRGFGFALSPMPLGLNGDMVADEKWRKQQILELEVYSKRLELVQDQIKAQLEDLRSMGG